MREEPSAVASDALRTELMSVPGVASAEVDLTDANAPGGVRVRLTADADARRVGAEVQRVLASHGMRSRFSDGDGDAVPDPAAEPAPVPLMPPPLPVAEEPSFPPPPVDSPPAPESPAEPVVEEPPAAVPMAAVPDPSAATPPLRIIRGGLEAVAMEERADGLAVRVTLDDGRVGSQPLTSEDTEILDSAVIAAVADAVEVDVETVATEWMEVEEASIVTVVLRLSDGALVAGAGVVRVGRAFAVGMAARAALAL
jgi:hypothetical protein